MGTHLSGDDVLACDMVNDTCTWRSVNRSEVDGPEPDQPSPTTAAVRDRRPRSLRSGSSAGNPSITTLPRNVAWIATKRLHKDHVNPFIPDIGTF